MISPTEARVRGLERKLNDALARLREFAAQLRGVQQQARNAFDSGSGANAGLGYVGKVTGSDITAASTGHYTTGTVNVQKLNAGAFADDVAGVTVYNSTDKGFKVGAYVSLTARYGVLWVDVIDKCANLV